MGAGPTGEWTVCSGRVPCLGGLSTREQAQEQEGMQEAARGTHDLNEKTLPGLVCSWLPITPRPALPSPPPSLPCGHGVEPRVLSETRSESVPEAAQKVERTQIGTADKANLSTRETQSGGAGRGRSGLVTAKKGPFTAPPRLPLPGHGTGPPPGAPPPSRPGGGEGASGEAKGGEWPQVKAVEIRDRTSVLETGSGTD